MDAKWKLVASHNRGDKYNLSQSDFYQLFAYGHKYLKKDETKELALIYPKTDSFDAQLPTFIFEDDYNLNVIPFDLEKDKLLIDANYFKLHQKSNS